jgi:hypothetical protein
MKSIILTCLQYNKWMFKDEDDKTGEKRNVFPFPLFTTALHQIVQFGLASLVIYLFPRFRVHAGSLDPHSSGESMQQLEPVDSKKPLMTKWFYATRIGPCGMATGFDIGLGNMSLRFISLTFFSMEHSRSLLDQELTASQLCANPQRSDLYFCSHSFSGSNSPRGDWSPSLAP